MENNTENKKKKLFSQTAGGRKRSRLGGYSFAICAVCLCLIVVLNLLVGIIPAKFTKFDTSDSKIYSLSDQTKAIVSGLSDDVTIYILEATASNTYSEMTSELLDRYKSENTHITVKSVDPVLNPSFYQSYTETAPTQNSLIVESEKRFKIVDFNEIVLVNQTPNYQTYSYDTTYSFAGESAITSALEYVTSDNLPKVYTITGNGELDFPDELTSAIGTDNIELQTTSLLSGNGGVPSDAQCVIIYAPTADLTADEIGYLDEYMENGGKVILSTTYDASLPNLYAFAESHGLTGVSGLVFESSSEYYYQYPYYPLATIASSDVSDLLSSSSLNILCPYSHGITESESAQDTITVSPLLKTSSSAYIKADPAASGTLEAEEGDATGSFMLGALSADSSSGGQLIWFSTPYICQKAGGNLEFFVATLDSVCEKEASVSIAAKSLSTTALVVPESSSAFWTAIICVIVPGAIIVTGALIWNRRRKR